MNFAANAHEELLGILSTNEQEGLVGSLAQQVGLEGEGEEASHQARNVLHVRAPRGEAPAEQLYRTLC